MTPWFPCTFARVPIQNSFADRLTLSFSHFNLYRLLTTYRLAYPKIYFYHFVNL